MPIYEYQCGACGSIEVIQKASEKPLKCCPQCEAKGKKTPVKRMVSPAAFHLKGGGWYKTDYAAKSNGSSSSTSSKESKGSEKGSETSGGETKSGADGGSAKKGPCGSACACVD